MTANIRPTIGGRLRVMSQIRVCSYCYLMQRAGRENTSNRQSNPCMVAHLSGDSSCGLLEADV